MHQWSVTPLYFRLYRARHEKTQKYHVSHVRFLICFTSKEKYIVFFFTLHEVGSNFPLRIMQTYILQLSKEVSVKHTQSIHTNLKQFHINDKILRKLLHKSRWFYPHEQKRWTFCTQYRSIYFWSKEYRYFEVKRTRFLHKMSFRTVACEY